MHPPLHINKHPHCKEAIEALTACHQEHPFGKIFGACNDQKLALDRCLREEKVINRGRNYERALVERERLQARLAQKGGADSIPGYGIRSKPQSQS